MIVTKLVQIDMNERSEGLIELKEAFKKVLARPGTQKRKRERLEYLHGYIMALEDTDVITEDEATDIRRHIQE